MAFRLSSCVFPEPGLQTRRLVVSPFARQKTGFQLECHSTTGFQCAFGTEPSGSAIVIYYLARLKAGFQYECHSTTGLQCALETGPSVSAVLLWQSSGLMIFKRMFLQNIAPPEGAVPKAKAWTLSPN